jgi:hypothetical protein
MRGKQRQSRQRTRKTGANAEGLLSGVTQLTYRSKLIFWLNSITRENHIKAVKSATWTLRNCWFLLFSSVKKPRTFPPLSLRLTLFLLKFIFS